MLCYDPKKRPTAQECLQYPVFQVKVQYPLNAPDFSKEKEIEDFLEGTKDFFTKYSPTEDDYELEINKRPSQTQKDFQ